MTQPGKQACIIGWPVAHSRSPLIHGYWLEKYGIDGGYVRQPVRPDDVVAFLRSMPERGLAGCNVTIPHKETAYAAADEKLPAARAVAAANTLWFEGDRLVAENTDGIGFMSDLAATFPSFDAKGCAAVVLGAGGAARAVVHALLEAGAREVRLFNRTRARADALARHFGPRVKPYDWRERIDRSREAGILVNATALGMKGGASLAMPLEQLDDACIVADLVYVPLITPLLTAAQQRGLATLNGLGMLLHQAVPGFAKWFGVTPEVTEELRALLVCDIEGS